MKTKKFLVISAIALTAALFTACGGSGGSSSSVVSKAVKDAEETVAEESSPVYGKIPSLQMQYDEAKKALKEHFKEAEKAIEDKFKDGGKMEDAIREAAKLEDERKAAQDELKQLYKEKIAAAASALAGSAVKVDFDKSQYSAASATFSASADSSLVNPLVIDVELTLAEPLFSRGIVANAVWNYQDAHGEELGAGAQNIKDFKTLKAGDKFTLRIIPPLSKEKASKFDHLFFKKAD